MTLKQFVKAHRAEIDAVARAGGYRGRLNDDEREDWVLNDESLYNRAKAKKVKDL